MQEKYGLSPAQYPEFGGAARRPQSDNLPSIPRLGEKTATKLGGRSTGDIAGLVDRVDEVKGKVGDALARTSRT